MPYTSSFPSLDIPDVDLWSFLFPRDGLGFPGTFKLVTSDDGSGVSYTYDGIRNASVEFAKGLKALWGWNKNDVLALYTPNSIDTPIVMFGTHWAGGVVSPANPLYTVDELAFQLKDSGAKALVTQAPFLKIATEAARKAGIPESRIILIGKQRDESGRFKHFRDIRTTAGALAKAKIDPDNDLAFLVYSSGTTGLPKGVCLTHRNVVSNVFQMNEVDGKTWTPGRDKMLAILPFFHIYGLVCLLLGAMYRGVEIIVHERFDLEKALMAIQNYGITLLYFPPPVVLALGKHPLVDKYDLNSVRIINSGAAPLSKELIEAVWNRLKIPVKQGFGLSEASPVTHCQQYDEWAKFMTSVGKLVSNMTAKIVDEDGNEVADGETGELWVKGPNVFKGYLNNPERTADSFSPDGYFKTGDVFRRDKYGNYYCVDRLKELIKYKGFPVPPAELEGVLLGHADVADSCVIGVEDKSQATEVPRAYVVLRAGVDASEAKAREIMEFVAGQVAPHKKLRGGIWFIKEVPKSASGKILRRLLRDQVREEEKASRPAAKL